MISPDVLVDNYTIVRRMFRRFFLLTFLRTIKSILVPSNHSDVASLGGYWRTCGAWAGKWRMHIGSLILITKILIRYLVTKFEIHFKYGSPTVLTRCQTYRCLYMIIIIKVLRTSVLAYCRIDPNFKLSDC